jgi:hypothetical protein
MNPARLAAYNSDDTNESNNDTFPLTNSHSNPWLDWAREQENVMQDSKTLSSIERPLNTSDITVTQLPPRSITSYNKDRCLYSLPTKEQLDLLLSYPFCCFCGKLAHRRYSLNYGILLECSNYRMNPNEDHVTKRVCGFHVHEASWKIFLQRFQDGGAVDSGYSELSTCPQYNFTFCVTFCVNSKYKLEPPMGLPKCYCNKHVELCKHDKLGYRFVCKNRRHCAWILSALQTTGLSPKERVHSRVRQKYQEKGRLTNTKIDKEQQDQHLHELLSVLTAPPGSPIANNNNEEVILCEDIVREVQEQQQQLPQGDLPSSSATPQKQTASTNEYNQPENITQQIQPETLYKILADRTRLQSQVAQLQTSLFLSRTDKDEETVFRISCQERLSNVELESIRLQEENEALKLQVKKIRKLLNESKCIVCSTNDICSYPLIQAEQEDISISNSIFE